MFYYLNIYNESFGFNGGVSHLYSLKETIRKAVGIVIGLHGNEQLLGGYWFLPQLFFASLFGFMVIKYFKNLYVGVVLVLLLTIVLSYFNLRMPYLPVGSLTLLSTLFFIIGYLYKRKFDNWNSWQLTSLFAIIVGFGSAFSYTTMLRFRTVEIIPYSVCAICGTIMILNISRYIATKSCKLKKILVFIGDNTMTVLTWHFLCFKIVSLIIIKYYGLPIEQLASFPVIQKHDWWWIAYSIVGVGVPLSIKYLLQKRYLSK